MGIRLIDIEEVGDSNTYTSTRFYGFSSKKNRGIAGLVVFKGTFLFSNSSVVQENN